MQALSFGQGTGLSHAYIAASASEIARRETEETLAMAAVCSGSGAKPCGVCRDCRKARSGVHPDIIHIRREMNEKGQTKQGIQVDQVREMITQAYIMPNEAPGKALIVHDAETMNPSAQNALLKLLEEPPKGVVLILSTATPTMLLPTIRSRCVEIATNVDAPAPDPAVLEDVDAYLKRVAAGKRSELLAWCTAKATGTDVAAAREFVYGVKTVLTEVLCGRRTGYGLSRQQSWDLITLMDTCTDYLAVNTGVKHLFGLIAVRSMRGEDPVEMRKQPSDRRSQY